MAAVKLQHKKLLTKYSSEEKNKHVICRPRSVRIGKNCALGLEYVPLRAVLKTSGTVFPNTDLPQANNIFMLSVLQHNVCLNINPGLHCLSMKNITELLMQVKISKDLKFVGSLRTRVFETRTATGSELFSLLTCPHTTTFTLLSIFSPL